MRALVWTLWAVATLGATPAWAQSDPDDDFEFESDPAPDLPDDLPGSDDDFEFDKKAPAPTDDGAEPLPTDDDIDFDDDDEIELGEPAPLDDGERLGEEALRAEGVDTLDLYRAQEAAVKRMPGDEEVMAWEAYLKAYPNSLFRGRIEDRVDELVTEQFQMRIASSSDDGGTDADREELLFVQPMHMTNVNPRTAVQLAVDFGFPTYLGMRADFEYAFLRSLSAHAGLQGRYTGWEFDVGARWAFVKSTRLKFIGTLVADIGINFNQRARALGNLGADANVTFFAARPQLAFGKIIGPVQILLSGGVDIGTRKEQSIGFVGGLHVSARVAPPVAIFLETDAYVRNMNRADPFAFGVLTFGLKFYPLGKRKDDPLEIGMGGHIPVATQYLQYYAGAVQAQGTYYLNL